MVAWIGIRREDKSPWERRVPLTPEQVRHLRESEGLHFIVQPSHTRVFKDEEYRVAGAHVNDDLSPCQVIFGIKEIPPQALEPHKTYVFFSHTIKGQAHNMPMLRRLLELKCQLIDYERITDAQGRRLIFFGYHAGLAGMIDSLWALGQRLAWEGISNPFIHVQQAYQYRDLGEAKAALRRVGEEIATKGLPADVVPLVVGIIGYGNVSRGAQEILDLLPCEEVAPFQLSDLFDSPPNVMHRIYKVVFKERDTVESVIPGGPFELQDYYRYPEKYRSRFESYLPYLTVLINAIYWEPRYPRLVTKESLKWLYAHRSPRLRVIGDISCDVNGAIECTVRCTSPDNPVFVYHPDSGEARDGVAGVGPVVLAVDILPTELPRESSTAFGMALLPFVPAIARADYRVPFEECQLPDEIRRAVICYQGELTPNYRYLEKYL